MKIYTKGGDKGQTSLIGGSRVAKDHVKIEAYGTVDELNSNLGMVAELVGEQQLSLIRKIQSGLFDIGSHLAAQPEQDVIPLPAIRMRDVTAMENAIDQMNEDLPKLKNFILPGGGKAAAQCHITRCVCRRAERRVVALSAIEKVDADMIIYLNRLSDYLFVLARKASSNAGETEINWVPNK